MLELKNKKRLENALTDYVCRIFDPDDVAIYGHSKVQTEEMRIVLGFLAALDRYPFERDIETDEENGTDDAAVEMLEEALKKLESC